MVSLRKEIEFQFKVTLGAEDGEREAIEEYYLNHLELPPCNHAKPKSKERETMLESR